jgi:hypothetical protein
MTVIKSIIVASVVVISGSAFASEGGNDIATRQITDSRVAFVTGQATSITPRALEFTGNVPFASKILNSTVFPVNTSSLSNGSTK